MPLFPFFQRKRKIGLALSGGGMRGVGHIAVLKALEEYGLHPDIISGTSAGAIVGAFYAAGKTPDEMLDIVRTSNFFSRSAFRLSRNGIFSPAFLLSLFQTHLGENDFDILKIPLYATATEITQGKTEYFSSGRLFEALLATSAVPFIFPPVILNEKFYVDGGVLNNLPTEIIQDQCDFLIGSHVNAMAPEASNKISLGIEFDRILHLAISGSVYTKSSTCDLFFNPPEMLRYSLFKKAGLEEMISSVYDYTCTKLEEHGFRRGKAK